MFTYSYFYYYYKFRANLSELQKGVVIQEASVLTKYGIMGDYHRSTHNPLVPTGGLCRTLRWRDSGPQLKRSFHGPREVRNPHSLEGSLM
ncbi:unnamed protein product [Rodentolepis nana]|uniref:Ovule protein n=1 Tax=Rodentolepis nana TaxID=102285 RepID=A0A0R3TVP0_RODNA|nr:unnamed protein product [Rodentolepis nana]